MFGFFYSLNNVEFKQALFTHMVVFLFFCFLITHANNIKAPIYPLLSEQKSGNGTLQEKAQQHQQQRTSTHRGKVMRGLTKMLRDAQAHGNSPAGAVQTGGVQKHQQHVEDGEQLHLKDRFRIVAFIKETCRRRL